MQSISLGVYSGSKKDTVNAPWESQDPPRSAQDAKSIIEKYKQNNPEYLKRHAHENKDAKSVDTASTTSGESAKK